ncbi:hypothetical protein QU593_11335 [Rossellomorea marisflavi]|nr:hypothetical protein [Rossellomorea marisflavi]WJV20991.1 hypothetical protein QU593_11335 [Rossellomorea marisflavi]
MGYQQHPFIRTGSINWCSSTSDLPGLNGFQSVCLAQRDISSLSSVGFIAYPDQGFLDRMEGKYSSNVKTEEEMVSLISSLELIDDAFIRKAILCMQEASPSGIGLLLALYRYHMPKALKGLSRPTLVLYGNREGKASRIQRRISRQVSNYQNQQPSFKSLVGGHYAHMSDKRSIGYIRDFLFSSEQVQRSEIR